MLFAKFPDCPQLVEGRQTGCPQLVEHRHIDTDQYRTTLTGKNRITSIKTFLFDHQKYHVDYPGIETDFCSKKPAKDLLNTTFSTNCVRGVRGLGWVGLGWACVAFAERNCM